MIKQILLMAITSIFLILSSCNSNPVIPPEIQPGRRDYTWVVDTVVSPTKYPSKTLYRLWASTPTDVWSTAHGGDPAANIFHFDGTRWISSADKYEGKYLIPWATYSIYGFSSSDVYIGCEAGRIYQYDGNSMKEVATLTKEGHNNIVFDNMWGESVNFSGTVSRTELYAFGAYADDQLLANGSVIAHCTNNEWTMMNTDGLVGIVEHLYKDKTNNNIYLQVIKYSNTYDTTFIYEYQQGKYSKLFKTVWGKNWASISLIDGEVYFILNTEIAKSVNGQFKMVLNLGSTNFYKNIWGRNSKDIFLEMTDGLAHYDGTDIEYLFHYDQSNVNIFGAAFFENDVFFLVHEFTTGQSLVYHGKLNNGG